MYIGAERVGLACLDRLVTLGKNVVGVLTADDSLEQKVADWVSFDSSTQRFGIPLHKVRSTKSSSTIDLVRSMSPDLVCVVSWSMIIPPEILEAGRLGCIGFHYSMLPQRRGGAPLNWAIIDGLKESGITLFYLDDGIDTGDVIAQAPFGIGVDDTVKDLLDKIVVIAPDLITGHIDGVLDGTGTRDKQDNSLATYTSRRTPADGEIDWSQPDEAIYNFVRALAPPYPCAFSKLGSRKIVVPSASIVDGRLKIEAYVE